MPYAMKTPRRAIALLEVLGVYLAGPLVAAQIGRLLGVHIPNPLDHFTAGISDSELVTGAGQMFALLILQYVGYFLLIIPINWLYRRRGPAAYGLTKARRSWPALLLAGVATVAAATVIVWPASTLLLVDSVYHLNLGGTVPWRQALFDTSWRRWEFWLFTAVMSWALIPVVEELFFRGYCQRRLAEDWGDAPAIVGTSFLFTFTHGQYLTLSLYNAAIIASLLVLAIAFGTVFAWTRSLYPAMIAHAVIDVPMTPAWQVVFLAVLLIGGILVFRRGLAVARDVFSNARVGLCLTLVAIGMAWAIASNKIDDLAYVAIGMVIVAVGLEALDRHRHSATQATANVLRTRR
jgi:membrane protease YdiL (CAAX protease family)